MNAEELSRVLAVIGAHGLIESWVTYTARCSCGAALAYDGCIDAYDEHLAAEIVRAVRGA